MNILPLIFALVLMLSFLTMEKVAKFKNQTIVQIEYQKFLENEERTLVNRRQKALFKVRNKSARQISFRYLLKKDDRDKSPENAQQARLIITKFLQILYGEKRFFKESEAKKPQLIEELLNAIQQAADAAPKDSIKRIEDIVRLNLDDPVLQTAFYYMLKGTISRKQLNEKESKFSISQKEKAYPSLLDFINFTNKAIAIQKASAALLLAIFENQSVVEAILAKRNELAAAPKNSGTEAAFKNEFSNKRRAGINENMLDFSITKSDKSEYNY